MLLYCLKCRRNTKGKNWKVVKTKNGRIMLLSNCAVCGSKKSGFINEPEFGNILSASFIFKLWKLMKNFLDK